jgi:hypothetical protein
MTVLIPARRSRFKVLAVNDGFAATPHSSGTLVAARADAAAPVARVAATAITRTEQTRSAKRRRWRGAAPLMPGVSAAEIATSIDPMRDGDQQGVT